MELHTDSIFALATPPGKSGVAVLRISGMEAGKSLETLTRRPLPAPRVATLAALYDPATQELIDQALVLYFPAPRSFTGEEMVELHVHGSRAVLSKLLAVLSALPGLRLANAGEFTRRALFHDKMDLTEVEGLADLINAESEAQRKQALAMAGGYAAAQYEALRRSMVQSLAFLEAWLDFPDEDLPDHVLEEVRHGLQQTASQISRLLDDGRVGERIRDGITIVILGAPNAGKSSLLNAIARREVAIVSEYAGTTRDLIEVHLDIGGYSMILVDTAGIRPTQDPVEQEGVSRALRRAEGAELRIILVDGAASPPIGSFTKELMDAHSILVFSKADLAATPLPHSIGGRKILSLSAQTGVGIDALLKEIEKRIQGMLPMQSHSVITRQRHRTELERALTHLTQAQAPLPLELRCEELRLAARHIGNITGKILTDELLGHIFSNFCIGK